MRNGSKTRTPIFIAYALGVVLAAFSSQADSAEVAISAPVGCGGKARALSLGSSRNLNFAPSCGSDLSLSEAEASRAKLAGAIPDGIVPVLEDHICDHNDSVGRSYTWATLEELKGGSDALAKLLAEAKVGTLFQHRQVVEALPRVEGEQHLALCSVEGMGPPTDCVTVAILTPQKTWLRAGTPTFWCNAIGQIRPSGAIEIAYEIASKLSPTVFAASLQVTLRKEQDLDAEVIEGLGHDRKIYSVKLRSSVAPRVSKTLKDGWRESLNFDMEITSGVGQSDHLSFQGDLTPMGVSRQSPSSQTEMRGLNDNERNLYLLTFDRLVGEALIAACENGKRADSKRIVCSE